MSFLKNLIGPSAEEVWREVAEARGGVFFPSSFINLRLYPAMQAQVGVWPVRVDVYNIDKMTFTRFRTTFFNPAGFKFHIRTKTVFSNLGISLGMQDIEVGHPDYGPHEPMFGTDSYLDLEEVKRSRSEFDDQYVIQGNDRERVIRFFRRYRIRDLIRPTTGMRFETVESQLLSDRLPPGVSKLEYLEVGINRDARRLGELFDLYGEALETLVEMGLTTHNAPRIELK